MHERRLRPKHTVNLAEDTVEVGDRAERVDADRDVDGVGSDERKISQIALMQLDPDLFALGESSRVRHLLNRLVDRDDTRAALRHRDGHRSTAATEFEDPLALEWTEQTQVRFGRDVGAVVHGVE